MPDLAKTLQGYYELTGHLDLMIEACDSALATNKRISKQVRLPSHDEEKRYWINARSGLIWAKKIAAQRYRRTLSARPATV